MLERERSIAAMHNKSAGSLTGHDCPDCLNRGYFVLVDEQCRRSCRECSCMELRRSLRRMENSGLGSLMARYTLDNWEQDEPWQSAALEKARDYLAKDSGAWFVISGRPGSGKTHLCTGICGALLRQGIPVRYMLWRDTAVLAKAAVNDEEEYKRILEPLKTVPVLYIDDFFKAGRDERGQMKVTPGDVNLAFELLNDRYNDDALRTIISCELSVGDLLSIDEGLGSRIRQRSRGFYTLLDKAENWRLK